jgi:hypothetical protein
VSSGARPRPLEHRRGLVWTILEHHYRARAEFGKIYKTYENRVQRLVKERKTPRDELKLNPPETKDLFDTWRLQALIQKHIQPLRAASHAYFRYNDVAEPFDSNVSRIYHELSILKEEHLSVRDFPATGGAREFARLFREVSEYYPQRLRRVRDLFNRSQKRLDALLPGFADDTIVLRSVFLFREELWPDNTNAGLTRFLGKMFEEKGAARGYLRVARSFFRAGFYEEAAKCARMGAAAAGKEAQARSSRAKEVRETISELDSLRARAEAELKALTDETQ